MAKRTYDYAREKFYEAVDALATSDASIQRRLASAATYLTRLHRPDEDLPEDLREEFKALMHNLTKEPAVGNEGTIDSTTAKLTPEEGRALASKILSIYTELDGI